MELNYLTAKNASYEDLKAMVAICEQELKNRNVARRDELVQAVCDAMNALHKEFPAIGLRINVQCSECALDEDFDVIEFLCDGRQMTSEDFYIY